MWPPTVVAVDFVVVVVADGAGMLVVDVVVPAGAASSYHSFTPLWPRQAPFFSALEE
jgi:hypothetical protein